MLPVGVVLSYEFFSGELVSVGYDFELSVVADDYVADEEVVEFDFWVLYFFEEDFMIFDVILDRCVGTISICCPGRK